MTQHEIKESHIMLTEDGRVALTIPGRNGKIKVLREITKAEIANMANVLYCLYKNEHPDENILPIPIDQDNILAIIKVQRREEPAK